jgi:hypothetical protein
MSRGKTSGPAWPITLPIFVAMVLWEIGMAGGAGASEDGGGVLGGRETGRLIERLDAASKAQGVCYGWEVDSGRMNLPPVTPVYSSGFRPSPHPEAKPAQRDSRVENGSNLGPDTDPRLVPAQCPRWVVLRADYTYSFIDEEWVSVNLEVDSNLPQRPSASDLTAVGITTSTLVGPYGAGGLSNAISALPMVVAQQGQAAVVPEPAPQQPPAGDKAESPGKGRYVGMALAILMIFGGVAWIVTGLVRGRRRSGSGPGDGPGRGPRQGPPSAGQGPPGSGPGRDRPGNGPAGPSQGPGSGYPPPPPDHAPQHPGTGPGHPQPGPGPGYPQPGRSPGHPQPGQGPGYPPPGQGPGYPYPGQGPGHPQPGQGPGYPYPGQGPGHPPPGQGPGYPYPGQGAGYPQAGPGPGYPPPGTGHGLDRSAP